ncbi:hypothetical protein [Candidatus Hepatoplasma crinochetorum]|uniref:hypothetical protein n=1 Tax=Candidatus Hepatoplasma crinochetorum TaxID=295596 RepID=UPI003086628F|nr:MAG: hypothetical protein HCTKY_0680 [Candidatus Hepatoplasma crinochetorum]
MIQNFFTNIINFLNAKYTDTQMLGADLDRTQDILIIILIAFAAAAILLLIIGFFYLISILRRTNVVMKKVDYLMEDITYKSESLNVTVETLNKLSNYLLLFDSSSKTGIKSLIKLFSENRNYFYSFADKLRENIDKKISEGKSKVKKASPKVKEKVDKLKKVINDYELKKENSQNVKPNLKKESEIKTKEIKVSKK